MTTSRVSDPEDVLDQTMRARVARVFCCVDELIGRLPSSAEHRALLAVHVEEGRARSELLPEAPWVQLPLLVHTAAGGDDADAVPIAAACTLVYLAVDLLDNLMDDELPERWASLGPARAILAAATLLGALPRLAFAGQPHADRIGQALAETLVTMSDGQNADLDLGSTVALDDVRGVAERKAGAEFGLFAEVGALSAAADEGVVAAYRAFGHSLGAAGQISSDLADVFDAEGSRDLRAGKRTLPVAYALGRLDRAKRTELERLLDQARGSIEAHAPVRALLVDAGSPQYTALVVGVYVSRARRALDDARPSPGPRRELEAILGRMQLHGGG